jgi:hypothetical protein
MCDIVGSVKDTSSHIILEAFRLWLMSAYYTQSNHDDKRKLRILSLFFVRLCYKFL